jgi:hypothetical protein
MRLGCFVFQMKPTLEYSYSLALTRFHRLRCIASIYISPTYLLLFISPLHLHCVVSFLGILIPEEIDECRVEKQVDPPNGVRMFYGLARKTSRGQGACIELYNMWIVRNYSILKLS